MAIRIPWDEQETAILIAACIAVNERKKTKKDAVKEVSDTLRQRAIDKGITIDNVFRNENGITMQFMLVNELLTQEKCGLRGASKIFIKMVDLYKSDRKEFNKILREASRMKIATKRIKEMFSEWLSKQLSPAQMSEIYITYYDIDEYLQKEKILPVPLLDTVDLDKIASIKKMIATNGKFRFFHRSKLDKYVKAVGYYYNWLSENQDKICMSAEALEPSEEAPTEAINHAKQEQSMLLSVKADEVKLIAKETVQQNEKKPYDETTEISDRRKQFSKWLNTKGLEPGMILASLMDISKMNKMAMNNGIINKDLYFVESPSALRMIGGRLQRRSDFLRLDIRLQEQYKKTWDNFIEYRAAQMVDRTTNELLDQQENWADRNSKHFLESLSKEEKNLSVILKEDYENGFRMNSAIDRGRFKVYYSNRFASELTLSDEQLMSALRKVGTVREDRIFAEQDEEQADLLNQVYAAMMEAFDNGASCVYTEAIYQKYKIKLEETVRIYDAEVLGNELVNISKGKLRKRQTFICLENRQADLKKDVLSMFEQSSVPLSYDDIEEYMWYVPINKIKDIMVTTKSIVYMKPKTYFYAPNLPINQEEIMLVKQLIHQKLEYKSHITDVELKKMIEKNCPSVAINTSEFTTYGLRNCLGYILRADYQFKGPIISAYGRELSMAEVFAEYCTDREQVTTDELKALASEMNARIYWDVVRERTIRISEDLLLRDDQIDFDVEAIDGVLESLNGKEYIPLKDIGLFMHFPPMSVCWNGYVLESFIHKYSRKFRLLHVSFSESGFFGAMVKKDSQIKDYQALIIDVLAHSNHWTGTKDALELLVGEGYQQRKRYANIERVIHEAKLLRERLNA